MRSGAEPDSWPGFKMRRARYTFSVNEWFD